MIPDIHKTVIVLQNPNPHRGQVYPLYGPVEFTYAEIAQVLSHVLGWGAI